MKRFLLFLPFICIAGCSSYKAYHFSARNEPVNYGNLLLHRDTFSLSFLRDNVLIYDFGTYTRKNDSLIFHSITKADTTFKKYIRQRYAVNYSIHPDTTLLLFANTSRSKIMNLEIKSDNHILIHNQAINSGTLLRFLLPYSENATVSVDCDGVVNVFHQHEVMLIENHCDTVSISGPFLHYALLDKKQITLSPISILNDRVYVFRK